MKFFLISAFATLSLGLFGSCKKDNGSGTVPNLTPSNLVIQSVVSQDGSGNVSFTATATNAVTFKYEFGNGVIQTVPTGVVTYKYTQSGTVSYSVTVTAIGSSGLMAAKTIDVTVTVTSGIPSNMVWSDEFNVNGAPDASKWGYDIGTGAGGWGNAELQYYTNRTENVVVENGVLKIKAIKESYSGSNYTSARLLSKGKYAFTYGKIEVRAKLPAGIGTWPAVWMLGSDISTVSWPACGEIDIVEHRGSELNKIFGSLHYPGRYGGNANGGTTTLPGATTDFHIYTAEWTATAIKFFVDGTQYFAVNNSASIPFNKDFFLLINFAMGGNFGGNVDPTFTTATLEVDYIRVYK